MAERKNDINWFPGHMRKALNETGERLKLVDLVYETCDARIPFSSRNPELDKIIGSKPRIVILNKADLADPSKTSRWIESFESDNTRACALESTHKKGFDKLNAITMEMMKDKLEKAAEKGRIGRPVRVMVVGAPNTGKSTIINAVCEKSFALNEQYRLPDNQPQARELLTEDIRMSVENVEQVGSRVVVKGKVWAEIWYLPDESNQAVKTEFSSPFSQIVDTGAEECVSSTATLNITNTYFDLVDTISGDKALDMEVHAVLQLVSRAEQEIDYLSDAYSNRLPLTCSSKSMVFKEMSAMQARVLDIEQDVNLGDECGEIFSVFSSLTQIGVNNTELNAQVNLDFVYGAEEGKPNAARRLVSIHLTDFPSGMRLLDARVLRVDVKAEKGRLLQNLFPESENLHAGKRVIRQVTLFHHGLKGIRL